MRALVLGGGNIDGIFAGAGAAKALDADRGAFDLLVGTSAGALVATATATGKLGRIEELIESLAPDQLVRPDEPFAELRRATRLLRKGHLLASGPLRALLAREFPDPLLAAVPPERLEIATFDLRRRRSFSWTPRIGGERFRAALFASMSVPFIMQAARLELEGRLYELVDGGVTATHPVSLAIPPLWQARERGEAAELVVVSTLSFKDEEDLPRSGLKRLYRMVKSVKAGFVIEQSNTAFDAADEVGIAQRWIQVETPNLEPDGFSREDLRRAFEDGFAAASAAA